MYLHPRCCGLTRIAPTSLGVSLGLFKLWWSNTITSVPYSFTILSIVLISFDEESTIINKSASLTSLIFLSALLFLSSLSGSSSFFFVNRSEEHTSELQSRFDIVCRLLLEKKKIKIKILQ